MLKPLSCALLALCFCSPAWSQQPPQNRMIIVPDQIQGTEPQQKPTAGQQDAAPPPIIVNVTQPPKSEADKQEERKEKQAKAESDRRIAELTASLARFTEYLFYATAVLGVAALFTLGVLIWQGRQMKRAVVIAEGAIRISERAVLWADKWTIRNIAAGLVPVVEYQLVNSGRSHAEIVAVHNGYGISAEEKVPTTPPYRAEDPLAPGIVGPNTSVHMEITLADALTSDETRDIRDGRSFLFLFGKIAFRDEFKWTCEVAYGAQYGNFGDRIPAVQFMKRPGYTYVQWYPPGQYEKRG